MPPSRFQSLSADRRKRGLPGGVILIAILVLVLAFLFWLTTIDTEKPVQKMEQDVTDALPKS